MKIVHYPHPALRHKAKPLTTIDKEVRLIAGRMLELMYAAKGLGLAANQVAYPYQLIVINPTPDDPERKQEMVLINPVILDHRGSIEGEEGCLSFMAVTVAVRRPVAVRVEAFDLEGRELTIDAEGGLASLMQHEIDHLDGILTLDRAEPGERRRAIAVLRESDRLPAPRHA